MKKRLHSGRAQVSRDAQGVLHVHADSSPDLIWGLGYAHALDRGLQLVLMRVLGQGRASELLEASAEMLEIDRFFRRMSWASRGKEENEAELSPTLRAWVEAYVAGVNDRLLAHPPWELRLLSLSPEPWTLADCMLMARMIGYLGLAQSQGDLERFLVELVQAGVSGERLEELFPGRLAGLDPALLRKVTLGQRVVPAAAFLAQVVPKMTASNNWVVAPGRSASGRALLASDPHLEVNRLPNVWAEVVLSGAGIEAMGATVPGIPGVLIGRNRHLAWGPTYSFMDAVDSWVEHVKHGRYRRGESTFIPFRKRAEVVRRKGQPPVELSFWENDHGVLDGEPLDEGFQLTTQWSGAAGGARSLAAAHDLLSARTVNEGRAALGRIESSFHWVLADAEGHIGYQMSGLMPRRREGWSGLYPVPGWDPDNDWRGWVPPEELPRALDPEAGFFATANQDLNHLGQVAAANADQGDYRSARIEALLAGNPKVDVDAMRHMQRELYSTQAERFMPLLRPLLPQGEEELSGWDLRYDAASLGATRFEHFYGALLASVFGRALSPAAWRHLTEETPLLADFFAHFDRVLLAERSAWFGGERREDHYRRALAEALAAPSQPWGERQRFVQRHLMLGGKLPLWVGFDRGPFVLEGGRATIHQGQLFKAGGRETSFAPSIRVLVDFAEEGLWSCLAGGPSDRRFSRWYNNEMQAWSKGQVKRVRPLPR